MIEKYKLYYRVFIAIFWIAMAFGFVAEEILPFLEPLRPMVFLALDGLVVLLGVATLRQRGDLVVALSYLVIAIFSTVIVNHYSITTFANGSRDFLGLILMVPIFRYFLTCDNSYKFRKDFDQQLKIWLWIQAFCITWQFARYGANDHGGGSMGEGASGMASMLIYLVSFYFVKQRWDTDNYWRSFRDNRIYIFLLYPTFLNETKISFIFLLAYFALLLSFDRKMIVRVFYIVPFSFVAIMGLGAAYLSITNQKSEDLLSKEFYEEYLYGIDIDFTVDVALMIQDGDMEIDPKEWWTMDIPRFAKMALVFQPLGDTAGGVLWGAGVGQFKGGQVVDETRFVKDNRWLLQGSRPWLFFVFVQLGFIGMIWFFAMIIRTVFSRRDRTKQLASRLQFYLLGTVCIILLYNDSFRVLGFCSIFFFLTMADCAVAQPRCSKG